MQTIDLDSGDQNCPDMVQVVVRIGDSVVVNNVSGDTLNWSAALDVGQDSEATGTITAGSNQTFTVPPGVWLTSASTTTLALSGGVYG